HRAQTPALAYLSLHDALPIWFAPATGVFTSFFRTHGLAGNQMYRPAMALDDNGRLWAGSTDGLTGFNPLDIEESVSEPSLRLTRDRKSTRLNSSHVKISYAVF